MSDLRRSWLVQRLTRPRGSFAGMKDNPFSFGGGLLNGGLSAEAMDLLRPIFGFDYMGSAEFEFGAVPKALQSFAQDAGHLTAWSFTIPLADVAARWDAPKNEPTPEGDATIYALARGEHVEEVERRVREWAAESFNRLKESTNLSSLLRPSREWHTDVAGWLELDNGFFFFADEAMWAATCGVFGIETAEVSA